MSKDFILFHFSREILNYKYVQQRQNTQEDVQYNCQDLGDNSRFCAHNSSKLITPQRPLGCYGEIAAEISCIRLAAVIFHVSQ